MSLLNYKSIIIIILFNTIQVYSATIEGIVTDSRTGEALGGANVVILNSKIGAATNHDGYYIIKNLSPGKYVIKTSFIVYESRIDSINITEEDDVIELNVKLKPPIIDLDSISTPQIEAYHEKLKGINEYKPVMTINIDSIKYLEHFLYAYLSMTNNTDDTIYIFKNYLCFNVVKPIITDSKGKLLESNMVIIDCVGEKTCPDSTDLLLIKPGEIIKYPLNKFSLYKFSGYPEGKYSIKVKYEFKKPVEINTFYCRGNSVLKTLIIGLRGTYISSNELEFINQ